MTYKEACEFLNKGRNKDRRPLCGRSTYMHRLSCGSIAVRYHYTDVLTIHSDGSYTFRTNGFHTVTTKARINQYYPWKYGHVFTDFDHMWFSRRGKNAIPFYEGMRVKKGKVISRDPMPSSEPISYDQAARNYRRRKYQERRERMKKANPLAFTRVGKYV